MGNLTATAVRNAKADPTKIRRLLDGDGLSLVIKPTGSRSWVLRVQVGGRRRDFGLGSAKHTSLADARESAARVRNEYSSGLDPVAEKRKRNAPPSPTFKVAAEKVHKELKRGWRKGKHSDDWLSSLERHAYPKLARLPVDQIDGPLIRETLLPIWQDIPETARRVRQRIGLVLDWAYSSGYRSSEAPLRSVSKGLAKQIKPRSHFAAMPYSDVPAFVQSLRAAGETTGRLALEFAILTAARSGEVRGARWTEIDVHEAVWTIPAARMKMKVAHQVPLPARAVEIVKQMKERERSELVFPGSKDRTISDMTLTQVMRKAKQTHTVHGFRSAFRDWAAEQTSVPGDVAEAALAHVVKNPTERAYLRTKYLDKRRDLMSRWAEFLDSCEGPSNLRQA